LEAAALPEEEGSSVESVPRAAVSSAPETEPEGRLEVADPSEDMALAEDVQVNANPPVAQAPATAPETVLPEPPATDSESEMELPSDPAAGEVVPASVSAKDPSGSPGPGADDGNTPSK
jgi:hypothetical protein